MQQGWIKLYRALLESAVFDSEKTLKVWVWCLLKASHKTSQFLWNGVQETLEPGQFISGRLRGASECKMNESTFWKCIKTLEKLQQLTLNSNNRFTVFTIVNWAEYQLDDEKVTAEEQPSNSQVTTKEQPSNTFKNVKNDKNERSTSTAKKSPDFPLDSHQCVLSLRLLNRIRSGLPNFRDPSIQAWASDIDKMMRLDKREPEEIAAVIDWCQNDSFWKSNILSTSKLRQKYDQLNAKRLNYAGPSTASHQSEQSRRATFKHGQADVERFRDNKATYGAILERYQRAGPDTEPTADG